MGVFKVDREVDANFRVNDHVTSFRNQPANTANAMLRRNSDHELQSFRPTVLWLKPLTFHVILPSRSLSTHALIGQDAPAIPIIIAGLTNDSNEQRENAAYAIGDLVERTEESAIKPFVVPFTGPLIRVATQATTYPPGVKTAILSALASMLERIPGHVKPFFPQLQRMFVKAISDTSSAVVRTRAADALGILVHSQPRVDPVVTELIAGVRSSEEEITTSFVLALSNVVKSSSAHGGIGDKARETCIELVNDAFRETHEDHYVQATATLIASSSGMEPHGIVPAPAFDPSRTRSQPSHTYFRCFCTRYRYSCTIH
ncbi:armadillo-type protein [Suillus subluteus]|nr:armadillo-type protein [Suillus subluteus]